jgi:hypothetical protein
MIDRSRLASSVFRLTAFALLLGSMACASGYHRVGTLGDGYSEQKLAPDRWLVTYATGGFARPERIARFLLRRSAEIAADDGARYFVVLSGAKGDFHPTGSKENLIENPPWAEAVVEDSMEAESQARRGYARIVIQLFKDQRPDGVADVYETREVLDRLGDSGRGKARS